MKSKWYLCLLRYESRFLLQVCVCTVSFKPAESATGTEEEAGLCGVEAGSDEEPGSWFITHCLLIFFRSYYKCSTLMKPLLMLAFKFPFCLRSSKICPRQGQRAVFRYISTSDLQKKAECELIVTFVRLTSVIKTGSSETLWKVLKVVLAHRTSQRLYESSGCCKLQPSGTLCAMK